MTISLSSETLKIIEWTNGLADRQSELQNSFATKKGWQHIYKLTVSSKGKRVGLTNIKTCRVSELILS